MGECYLIGTNQSCAYRQIPMLSQYISASLPFSIALTGTADVQLSRDKKGTWYHVLKISQLQTDKSRQNVSQVPANGLQFMLMLFNAAGLQNLSSN